RQAQKAEYDQSVAGQAIETFTQFMVLYPNDTRLAEAQKLIGDLKTEQARGNFQIARYYEDKKRWKGAEVYYNEAFSSDPGGPYAEAAKKRWDALKKRTEIQTAQK